MKWEEGLDRIALGGAFLWIVGTLIITVALIILNGTSAIDVSQVLVLAAVPALLLVLTVKVLRWIIAGFMGQK
jgi:hypothetical protein